MDQENPFVKTFQDTYKTVCGKEVRIVGSPSGCDSRLWKNIAKCPTIQYGPGDLAQCHAINEWLELEDYWQSILIYAQLILNWGNQQTL